MITIVSIFANLGEKIGVFLKKKPYAMIHFLEKLAVVWAKNAIIFAKFFRQKYILKIITSVPEFVFLEVLLGWRNVHG
jgi:hypothetical protein